MTILTRRMLDQVGCETPGCTHDHSVLNVVAACHPEEGLEVAYHKADGVLRIYCEVCGTGIAKIAVARGMDA